MADRLEWFTITVPPNTAIASPIVFPCVFLQGNVIEIDVKVPPGPSGNVGFFIGAGGSQYVPRTRGSFVMPDDDYFTWPLENAINSGSWSVTAYNTDQWPHTLQFGFQVNEIGTAHVTPQSGLTSSSDALVAASALVTPDQGPAIDPLSPDALLASLPADLTAELV